MHFKYREGIFATTPTARRCIYFKGKKSCLSNAFRCIVLSWVILFYSDETAYQYRQSSYHGDRSIAGIIHAAPERYDAIPTTSDWRKAPSQMMYVLMLRTIKGNAYLRTGLSWDALLIENVPRVELWKRLHARMKLTGKSADESSRTFETIPIGLGPTQQDLTRFSIQAKGRDGKSTRKPLAYRESNNIHLFVTRPPEICVNLVFKHIHAVSSYTNRKQFVPFMYSPLWERVLPDIQSTLILSPLGTMFVHEGAESRVSWRQTVRAEVIAASIGVQVQGYPMFARFVAVVGVAHEGDRQSVYRHRQ